MEKIKYYSFDMFDTIITRLTNKPTDLFSIIEKKYNIQNFKKKRIEAERAARKKSKYEDITIDDIYDYLKIIDSSINVSKVKKIEKELEIKMCVINENFIDTYYKLKENGEKIIIITDMYLDSDTIKKILSKNDLSYYKLYISSEVKKAKYTGSLYKYVLDDLNIAPNQIIHYGDNKISDVNTAKKIGIEAILVNNKWDDNLNIYNNNEKDYRYLAIGKFINYNMKNKFSDQTHNYFYKVGYQTLGPLLYGYCQWLNKNLNNSNIKKAFFLSRDGKIIKKAFNILFPDFNTCYMFASRRGLIVPTLCLYEELKDPIYLKNIYKTGRKLKMEIFLKMVGLEDVDINHVLKKYNIDLTDEIDLMDSRFKSFYNEIHPLIIENSKNEFDEMIKYLKKIEFNDEIGIVDIGWNGNLQYALENAIKFSKINAEIKGYYVGISSKSKKIEIQDMSGYLYQNDIDEKIIHYVGIFELFFSSTEGSFKRYSNKGFEFYEYEYNNSKVKIYLEKIQEGAIDFIHDFSKSQLADFINISPSIALLNFNKLGNSPSNEDLDYFKKIRFYSYELHPFISNSRDNYLFHPKSFIKDFKNSFWKPGFLNLTIRANHDYSKLLNISAQLLNFIIKN